MALPSLSPLSAEEMRAVNQELVSFSVNLSKVRLPMKMMGGAFGRMARELRNSTESAILLSKLSPDRTVNELAVAMEEMLIPTLSLMERSAFKTRQAIGMQLRKAETSLERELQNIEDTLAQLGKKLSETSKLEASAVTEEMRSKYTEEKKIIIETMTLQRRQRDEAMSLATASDKQQEKFKKLLKDFGDAVTDEQRELIQARIAGMIEGDQQVLQVLQKRFEQEKMSYSEQTESLSTASEEESTKIEESLKQKRKVLKALDREIKAMKQGIKLRKQAEGGTVGGYKAGAKGFMGEFMSKTFSTGLLGFLQGDVGIGDIALGLADTALDRSGVYGKVLPKALGGGTVGGTLFGPESEKGRKAAAGVAERAGALREGGAAILRAQGVTAVGGGEAGVDDDNTDSLIDAFEEMQFEEVHDAMLESGSIYTHDVNVENVLLQILDVLQGGKGTAPKMGTPKPAGGKEGGLKGRSGGGGIGGFIQGLLTGIAEGVKAFGSKDVLKGALGMALVGVALIPFAFALNMMSQVDALGVLVAIGAIYALVGALFLLGKLDPYTLLIGAAALLVIGTTMMMVGAALLMAGAGIMLFSMAFERMAEIPFSDLMKVVVAIGLAVGMMAMSIGVLAIIAPLAPLALLTMITFAAGIAAVGLATKLLDQETLDSFSGFITKITENAGMLFVAAMGLLAISRSILALGISITIVDALLAAGAAIRGIASFLGFDPGPGIIGIVTMLAEKAQALQQTAAALQQIASAISQIGSAINEFGDGEMAMETINKIVSLDATEMKNLQDVSIAMEKVTTANEKLKEEKAAASAKGQGETSNNVVSNVNNIGQATTMLPGTRSRSSDPSILFSGERYYSMIYR